MSAYQERLLYLCRFLEIDLFLEKSSMTREDPKCILQLDYIIFNQLNLCRFSEIDLFLKKKKKKKKKSLVKQYPKFILQLIIPFLFLNNT